MKLALFCLICILGGRCCATATNVYEATISRDTTFCAIDTWMQNDASVDAPNDLTHANIRLHGRGLVTGLDASPCSLALDEGVACDITAATATKFSGYGAFLVRASSITAAREFPAGLAWGILGGTNADKTETIASPLVVKCSPFYSYGHVKLDNATFAAGGISGLYSYDVRVMSGNLILGGNKLSPRSYDVATGATITLDGAGELSIDSSCMLQGSGRGGGFYGQGAFAVAAGRSVNGGYLGVSAKRAYAGERLVRCQYVWADNVRVGRNATLKFTVMNEAFDGYLADMLSRIVVDAGGKVQLTKHGAKTPFATFVSTRDDTCVDPRRFGREIRKPDDEITGKVEGRAQRTEEPQKRIAPCIPGVKRPNIIFVLADDLGYGDVGWTVQNARRRNGQDYIATPHMDQMVAEGCELTAHYAAAPVCAPSRASILTGRHQGHCSLRDNSFDCPILEVRTIGTVMRELGYVTHAVGKWGVGGGGESGLPMVAHPLDRGFDHFYGFLDHMAGHTYYHYDGLVNGAYMGIVEDRARKTETAVGLYSTDLLMARAKKILIDQTRANKTSGTYKPVFMYLAINAMHGSGADKLDASVPHKANLHVPGRAFPDCTPETAGRFGVNNGLDWDWLQSHREKIADRNTFIYAYAKKYDTPAKRRYATTITRLDEAMADLKQTIVDLGIADNTIIVFTSDNGPTNEYGTNKDAFDSNGEFRGGKRECWEGGLREPTFIWGPGYVKKGTKDNRPSMNHSWLKFLEEIAKTGRVAQLSDEVYAEYAYGHSQIMARIGDYVGVNVAVPNCTLDTLTLKIYNVVTDPGQTVDLADTEKGRELMPRMRELMKGCHILWKRPGGYGNGLKQIRRPYDK